VRGGVFAPVPLAGAVAELKTVPPALLDEAAAFFG